ncbi:hypothetical protein Vi05172_g12296 [Venturia inaequalis]|nr:hypothetical protein Vi05172_g12296 [Venturia inaequalis]
MSSADVHPSIPVKKQQRRDASTRLNIIIVGAGLGGVGSAISLLLAGHRVTIFEAASQIAEIGAGIQILPNSSRVLQSWGMRGLLEPVATKPSRVNMWGWKGNMITYVDTEKSAAEYPGTFYWDFHRANLHTALLRRASELGVQLKINARVVDVRIASDEAEDATVVLDSGEEFVADLVVGADGINSRMREVLMGRPDPPIPTGDLAYRLLLNAEDVLKDPELAHFIKQPQVNYWIGPDAHAVNYVLKGGKLFNMVLIVPDDMPFGGANTLQGDVDEMRAHFKGWDPKILKLLELCGSVRKWRLRIRTGMDDWSHPSGAFTMLGDAVHATLPYLASGAGMCLEDAAVLGELFSRAPNPKDPRTKKQLLKIYENCRKERTEMVVQRGNLQQWLYHLPDGPEQEERDRKMRVAEEGEAMVMRDSGLAPQLLGYQVEKNIDQYWPVVEMQETARM